ncbi:hypothetical protein LCGC14_1417130 [marine sediment metagenome]|uniref:Uncharacterized protein n=1 Tax=marine sediment metagenome TaxID=412755 RepID=A0A0F9M816_9ZZZZ
MNINSRREEIIIELEMILNFSYLNLRNKLIYFMVSLISYTFKVLPIKKINKWCKNWEKYLVLLVYLVE